MACFRKRYDCIDLSPRNLRYPEEHKRNRTYIKKRSPLKISELLFIGGETGL